MKFYQKNIPLYRGVFPTIKGVSLAGGEPRWPSARSQGWLAGLVEAGGGDGAATGRRAPWQTLDVARAPAEAEGADLLEVEQDVANAVGVEVLVGLEADTDQALPDTGCQVSYVVVVVQLAGVVHALEGDTNAVVQRGSAGGHLEFGFVDTGHAVHLAFDRE
jgi:hypothetical protein